MTIIKLKHIYSVSKLRNALVFSMAILLFSCEDTTPIVATEAKPFCLENFMKDDLETATVIKAAVHETISLTASVDYNPDKVIHFVSLVSGVITNTYFSLGEEVKKGQVLLELKSTELSSLNAQQSSLQSQILVAKRELESIEQMYEDQIASQKDLIEAQSNLAVLESELGNAQSQLELYSASGERGVFQVKAPTSGVIVNKNIASGMQIGAEGDPLFTISDLKEVWVLANIYAGNVPYVKNDMKVKIQAMSYPENHIEGTISNISQVFDTNERVLKARIVIDNTKGELMPGMLVDVLVEKDDGQIAHAVPLDALIFDTNHYFLLIYKNDCDIEVRNVTPLTQNADVVYFKNTINEGEKVITKNHLLLYNQLKALK